MPEQKTMDNKSLRIAIAKAKGWTDIRYESRFNDLKGKQHNQRGHRKLPNWPVCISHAWELVEELTHAGSFELKNFPSSGGGMVRIDMGFGRQLRHKRQANRRCRHRAACHLPRLLGLPLSPRQGGRKQRMKIIAVSDLHGQLPTIPACDLLLIAGDICPAYDHTHAAQVNFLDGPFRDWLNSVPAVEVVGIAGNHDFIFERDPDAIPDSLQWHYLKDSEVNINGYTIWGTPWQPRFFDWAFNLDEPQLAEKWALIPQNIDILITHGPPRGFGDRTTANIDTGSPSLAKRGDEVAPKLWVFGHIHEGRGRWKVGNGIRANVTLLDVNYRQRFKPMEFDFPTPEGGGDER